MVAAVSDFTPKYPQEGKLKKSMIGEAWNLELIQTPDILASLDKMDIKTVAFKAEMDSEHGLANAQALLETKRVDAVCYNLLNNSESFGTSDNEITFITKEKQIPLSRADKLTLSDKILTEAKALLHE
jgi:phosphopantothenoylcysteine decarboxylase/phosphopantothenate--cysteine ligase